MSAVYGNCLHEGGLRGIYSMNQSRVQYMSENRYTWINTSSC